MKPVVGEPDVGRKFRLRSRVIEIVADMGKEGSARFELFHEGERAFEMRVAGMRLPAESIQNQDIQILEQGNALGWNIAHVREVSGRPKAVSGDCLRAMLYGDALKAGSEEIGPGSRRRLVQRMDGDASSRRVAIVLPEGVIEDSPQGVRCLYIGIDWKILLQLEAEGTQIIEAEDMVGMSMRIEDGIDVADTFANRLCVKVGSGVDKDDAVVVDQPQRRARAAVVRISGRRGCGGADSAVAAKGGHPHGRARTEKREGRLHC